MSLIDDHPEDYAAWKDAGGVEDNFRAYLLATGVIAVTPADAVFMLRQGIAHLSEMANVAEKLTQ